MLRCLSCSALCCWVLRSLANEKCLISWKEIAQPKLQPRGPLINEPSFSKRGLAPGKLVRNSTCSLSGVAYLQQFNAYILDYLHVIKNGIRLFS